MRKAQTPPRGDHLERRRSETGVDPALDARYRRYAERVAGRRWSAGEQR
ncbi:hypothetical protein ACFQL1_03360 [Halomicroarcula sp. GCM10025709]|nr:hypothetical protein [Halomicroarcula sp. YJ-61-S]